jgi:hypothetical protein
MEASSASTSSAALIKVEATPSQRLLLDGIENTVREKRKKKKKKKKKSRKEGKEE